MKRMKERCWLSEVDVEIEDRDGDLKVMPWYLVVLIAGGLFVVFTFEISMALDLCAYLATHRTF